MVNTPPTSTDQFPGSYIHATANKVFPTEYEHYNEISNPVFSWIFTVLFLNKLFEGQYKPVCYCCEKDTELHVQKYFSFKLIKFANHCRV